MNAFMKYDQQRSASGAALIEDLELSIARAEQSKKHAKMLLDAARVLNQGLHHDFLKSLMLQSNQTDAPMAD